MKSVMSRSALGRRVAATAVLGLATTTLSLGLAGSASAVGQDIEGTVRGVGGVAVQDACVDVYNAADNSYLDEYCTAADGHYEFTGLGVSQVKIEVYDDSSFAFSGDTQYLDRFYGGSRHVENATPVAITAGGDKMLDLSMTPAAVITGSVAAADGHQLTSYWDTDVLDSDFQYPSYREATDGGINFKIAIEPGTYRVGGYGADSSGPSYFEAWWANADSMVAATPVTVAAGQTVSGINIRLTNSLTARQAPSISGFPAVGRPLTANPGTWNRNAETEFSYTWMRGATVVGTGATYTPTAADLGQRLNVIVKALNGANAGQAVSAQTDTVRWPATAKGKAKALGHHKVRFAVKMVSAKQKPVKGKVVVMRGSKVVHKAVKLVKGKAVIVVKAQPKGKQMFTVLYKGNKVLAKSAKDFSVRVR